MSSSTRFGKYDLLALLATGGMAEIWLARVSGMAGFEKLVVIKRLLDKLAIDSDYVEMFLDEARINARLTHSNIVQVLELGQVEGKYFMAMEFVPGLSVSQVGKRATKQLGTVPQEVACGIIAQACSGLHYAHEKTMPDGSPLNIVHRDVSPQNLIVTYEGLVKVLDFGIAKADHRQSQTRTGLVKGKFSYMSPEQCLGQGLDRRSDVFALGIVLFELCTARRLFKRGSTYET
jgi:eukaryotic-like serine/threonine-protein kinase